MSWFVPGRLEVLGKHTDYAGGRSLLAAVNRGITINVTEASDGISASTDASDGEVRLAPGVANERPAGHWSHYLQTVIDRLSANFGEPKPCRIEISSTLPLASGMSSSSALIVATSLALADFNRFTETPAWRENIETRIDMAGYFACVENGMSFGTLAGHRGVGTFGGSEDHTAMLCCQADRLSQVRFCPIVVEDEADFPSDYAFVVAVSGVLAEKTGAARDLYNRASLSTRELVARWNEATGQNHSTLAQALASDDEAQDRLAALVADDDYLTRRLRAFVRESDDLIPAAMAALKTGNMGHFGELAYASHDNASRILGNQIAETDRLVELARELGALGSTGFGAGFGGSVWALTASADAEAFASEWHRRYCAEYPQHAPTASVLVTRPGASAHRV